jgi:DNA-binding response OmpR family regulator
VIKVLIVDADATTRVQLAAALRRGTFEVVSATDASAAWRVLQSADPPRILVLDAPPGDLEPPALIARLRGLPGGDACWVILTGSGDGHEDRLAAFGAGGDDYLAKPVDAAELRARVSVATRLIARIETLERELERRRFAA